MSLLGLHSPGQYKEFQKARASITQSRVYLSMILECFNELGKTLYTDISNRFTYLDNLLDFIIYFIHQISILRCQVPKALETT